METRASSTDPPALAQHLLGELTALANPDNVAGMARYGISAERNLGVSMPDIKRLAREGRSTLGRDKTAWHELALALWALGYRDTRLCATFVDHPSMVTAKQMDAWVLDLDSWDVCDGVCLHLFDRAEPAWDKTYEWSSAEPEFVKRAGFVLVAGMASHDKTAPDEAFTAFLPVIEREAYDERNFVKKAVNWALRHIGKRNAELNPEAVACAERILASALEVSPATPGSRAARWIARDALRELTGDAVRGRLGLLG